MRSDNCVWIERLDFVERRDPLAPRLRIRLGEIEVHIVVGGIAGNHEPDQRNIQTGRMIRVGMAEFHSDQFLPFQINYVPLEFLRDHQVVRNLSWECRLPALREPLRGRILAHNLYDLGRRNGCSIWKSLQKSADSEPMVSATMRYVDGCQVLVFSRS